MRDIKAPEEGNSIERLSGHISIYASVLIDRTARMTLPEQNMNSEQSVSFNRSRKVDY